MQRLLHTRGSSSEAKWRLPDRHGKLAAALTLFVGYTLLIPAVTAHPPVRPLDGNGGSSSSTGIIIGCVVVIVVVMSITGLIAMLCMLRYRRRLRYGRNHVYADADTIAFQDDHGNASQPRAAANANPREGTETVGLYSQRTVETNEPVTPPPDANTPQMRGLRENYADHFECRSDDGVRPASPNAERVEGITIENRIRPRRHLPRGQVVVQHENQDVCLDFRGVERVPQAGPPPLTEEEKQRIIDAQNRVASPEFYGRAEYEHRRASNNNTPNVLLSSSLLRDLQQQYAAASASGHIFPSYASDAGHSIESMSFRPGSPAGSVRRGRREGRQSTSPTSATIGGQSLRHRKNGSRNHTNSRDASGVHQHASIPRHYRDDLESTSDDFEDLSLHNESFAALREKLRDASSHPLQSSTGFPALGVSFGFDQMSLRSNSPGAFDRYVSATGSINGGAGLNVSAVSGYRMPSPLDHPQDPPAALAHTPHGLQSAEHTPILSHAMWPATARGSSHATLTTVPEVSRNNVFRDDIRKTTADSRHTVNTTSISNGSAQSSKSSTVSPGMLPTLPNLSPTRSPPNPSNPTIQLLSVPEDPLVHSIGRYGSAEADRHKQQHHSPFATAALLTPILSLHSESAPTSALDSRAAASGGGLSARYLDASLGLHGRVSTPSKSDQLLSPESMSGAVHHSGGAHRVQASQTVYLTAEVRNVNSRNVAAPQSLLPKEEEKHVDASRGHSTHSKSD